MDMIPRWTEESEEAVGPMIDLRRVAWPNPGRILPLPPDTPGPLDKEMIDTDTGTSCG